MLAFVCLSAQTPNIEGDRLPPDSYLLVLGSLCSVSLSVCLPLPKLPLEDGARVNATDEKKSEGTSLL